MDYTPVLIAISLVWICASYHRHRHQSSTIKLPPGPRPLPIIGNILELGEKPHQSLANLSKTYGPIMSLKLGSVKTIVISSPKTAQLILQKHDQTFSGRSIPAGGRVLGHDRYSMVWLPPMANNYRNLRKLFSSQLFSAQSLRANQGLRHIKVQELLDYVHESCTKGESVDIGRVAFTTSLNLLSNTIFSVDLTSHSSSSSQEFKDLIWTALEELGKFNIADLFPCLGVIDLQGATQRVTQLFRRILSIYESIIIQRLDSSNEDSSDKNDALDVMLRSIKQDGSELKLDHIKHLILDLFGAGTDTTSSTVEWAMTELIHNPTKMSKAQAELRQVLGRSKPVQESDVASLPYLQAIVKETFRLHPPTPLLLPHKAEDDIEINGFFIHKNSRVIVNAWAIGRDPTTWSDPNVFMPERFLDQKIDVKGQDFELLPFGSGRRMCPGLPLAHRMIHLMLASLLLCFDWKLEDGMKVEDMDMSEKFGVTLRRNEPLLAVPIKIEVN